VLVSTDSLALSALCLESGEPLWTAPLGRITRNVDVDGPFVAAIDEAGPSLVLLDCHCGKVLWRVLLESGPRTAPIIAGRQILAGTDRGLDFRSLASGARIQTAPTGAPGSPPAIDGLRAALLNEAGEVVVCDLASGAIIYRAGGAACAPLIQQEALVYLSGGDLIRYDLRVRQSTSLMPRVEEWLGAVTTPLVAAGPALYFGSAKYGWIKAAPRF